ncbi:MAG: AsmA family protein, partial [Bacteroidota bacterium]
MEQKTVVKKKKSIFKRLLLILGLGIGLLVLAAVVIAAFFQNAVGKQLISQINKQLKTELTVGEVDLSLLKGFPNATVILREVTVMDIFKEPLLEAKEVSFHFGLLSLFGKQVQVHSVAIRDGALNIRTNKNGKANYDIFKPTESEEPAKFNIALQKATLEKMELMYRDERQRQEMMTLVEAAEFSGEFSSEKYDLKSTAKLATNFVDLGGVRYLAGKHLGYNADIHVDVTKGLYDLKNVEVTVEDNVFKLDGKVISQKNFSDFDLAATAEDANLESVVALLPEQFLAALGDFSSTGRFEFGASVKGRMSSTQTPAIVMNVSLEDGKVNSPRLEEPFKDVSFQMNFTNGDQRSNQTTFFEIRDFKGYLNRQLITMSLRMDNLDDPYIDFSADGAVPLGYVYGLFNSPAITGGGGEIEFKNLKLNGLYNDMLSVSRIMAVTMSGDISFDDASLKVNEENMVFDRGSLHFDNNLVALQDLKLDGAGSEINLKGSARNFLPALFSDSMNSQNAALEFEAELFSPKMDVGRLVKLTDVPVQEGEVQPAVYDSLKVENTQ